MHTPASVESSGLEQPDILASEVRMRHPWFGMCDSSSLIGEDKSL